MFKLIPHTADIRLKVEAKTLEALFADALAGMSEVIKPGSCNKIKDLPIIENISIESVDETTLLIDFLSEVLTLSDEKEAVFCKIKLIEFFDNSLKAEIYGAKVDEFAEDIKAVTYHEADVQKNSKGSYETIIVFDI